MNQESILRSRMINLLSSSAIQRINFTSSFYSIKSHNFKAIAVCLQIGTYKVCIDSKSLASLGAAASFSEGAFTFGSVTAGATFYDQMAIIHECAHAINSAHGFRYLATYTDDEASAYIAGCLYYAQLTDPTKLWFYLDEPFKSAFDIALKVLRAKSDNYVVSAEDVLRLRIKVAQNPTYRKQHITLGTLASIG